MLTITPNTVGSHVEAKDLAAHIGCRVLIHGVIYKIRVMSGFAFVLLQTRENILQCVWSADDSDFSIGELRCNMAVVFSGDVIAEERSRSGYELRIRSFTALSNPTGEPPVVIHGKELSASLDTLLDYRPLTLRNAGERAIFKLQEGICRGFRAFLERKGFTEIHSPKIVSSGAEGGANIFALNYFGRKAYLAQSPQFYKQMMVGVYERVFEIAPVFRAEKHHTSRHINEYTSVDLEMGFIESFADIMALETEMIIDTLEYLKEVYPQELRLLRVKLPQVTGIPSIPFGEAKELISRTYHRAVTDFEDFEPEEEKLLCKIIKKRTGSDFVFVTHYLSSKRPFYAMDTAGNAAVTESFDLLFRGLEVTTGGQRIHDYGMQIEKMQKKGMSIDLFESYLMAHKYGLPPHGGLGLGLERFTARLLDLPNVRQATLFPRDTERLEP